MSKDNPIVLKINEKYDIVFSLNASGHLWKIIHNSGLSVTETMGAMPDPSNIGVCRDTRFTLWSDKAGDFELRVGLVRPWQPDTVDSEKTFVFKIVE